MSKNIKTPGSLLILVINGFLLFGVSTHWWASRDNNLYNNDRWLVGKNSVKFVFQTFHFMFAPLDNQQVRLNAFMGYHELLYHQPETPDQRLQELVFDFAVSNYRYLWVELRKEGERKLAVRLSRREGYDSGFYEYDDAGQLVRFEPLDRPLKRITSTPIETGRLVQEDDAWKLYINDQLHGQTRDVSWSTGYFGFRGSGATDEVWLRTIRMTFAEPNGKIRTETETFQKPPLSSRVAGRLALFALGVLVLRQGRHRLLTPCIRIGRKTHWSVLDHLGLTLFLLLLPCLPGLDPTEVLGGSLLGAELWSLIGFTMLRDRTAPAQAAQRIPIAWAGLAVLCLLSGAVFKKHGVWLGRAGYVNEAFQARVHPGAFLVDPPIPEHLAPIRRTQPFEVVQGRPYFTGPAAFREQQINLAFTMPAEATLDLVFQQQSFRTAGDAEGEPMPLQRRLVRLSTHPYVPTGVADKTGRIPGKMYSLTGQVQAGQTNTLTLIAASDGLTVILNGDATILPDIKPLGFGETGLLAHEQPVRITALEIMPVAGIAARNRYLALVGGMAPLLVLVGLGLGHAPAKTYRMAQLIPPGLCVLLPLALYGLGCLLIDRETLSYIGEQRVPLLDLTLTAAALNLFYFPLLNAGRMRWAPLYGNLYLLLLIAGAVLFAWDHRIPDTHPLKIKFNEENQAPAGSFKVGKPKAGPWYNDAARIGANLYVWNQRFEGKPAPGPKSKGTIRVFVMGGSQAWGSGAESSATTFTRLLHAQLLATTLPVEIFNAAINGAGIFQISAFFREVISPVYEPDILVLDFGLNDSAGLRSSGATQAVFDSFRELAIYCRKRGIDVLVVQEPMSSETPLQPYPGLYEGIRDIVEELGGTCLQPAEHFKAKERDHFVWWDVAHLTPFGHQLMAETIAPELERMVRERLQENTGTNDPE